MKYAIYKGVKTHAKDVNSGDIGHDIWFTNYQVKACVGKYRQYWKYIGDTPKLPKGYEAETEWHALYKQPISDDFCDVVCGDKREHRADIKGVNNVIEIQRKSIDGFVLEERTGFYKKLTNSRVIWVVDIQDPWKNGRIKTTPVDKYKFIITWKKW